MERMNRPDDICECGHSHYVGKITKPLDSCTHCECEKYNPSPQTKQSGVERSLTSDGVSPQLNMAEKSSVSQLNKTADTNDFLAQIEKDIDLVNQIYNNMIIRGILVEADNSYEEGIDKSELKILAYHVRKRAMKERLARAKDEVAIRKELLRKAEALYRFIKAEKKEEYNRLLDFEKERISDLEEGIQILEGQE